MFHAFESDPFTTCFLHPEFLGDISLLKAWEKTSSLFLLNFPFNKNG